MGIWTVWHGTYRLDGIIKAITALASLITAGLLVPLMPMLVQLPSPTQLRKTQEELRLLNQELEERVLERTAQLQRSADSLERANQDLLHEIERRRLVEDQLLQSQKLEAIGRLAGGVAHDFNNLLTVILGYNDMVLGEPGVGNQVLKSALEIQSAGERAAILVKQLLVFSRRQVIRPGIIDLNAAVHRIDGMLHRLISEDIDLSIQLDPKLQTVKIDPTQIDQVLMNLAVNASDAMPEGGTLRIATADILVDNEFGQAHAGMAPGHYAALSVADSGYGMNPETRQHIFEPFFTTKDIGKGSGLGLSIVYGIVQQNGGHVWVDSVEGKGTTFTLYLPVALANTTMAADSSPAEPVLSPGTETVLIVEDEEPVRTLVSIVLRKQGYTVLECGNASEAERLCQDYSGPLNLLLTDVVMPGMNGPDLADRLTSLRPGMKVLFMSGHGDSAVARHRIGQGAPYIEKPFLADVLSRKVRDLLSQRLPAG
jgi:signal transduction histidine kinase